MKLIDFFKKIVGDLQLGSIRIALWLMVIRDMKYLDFNGFNCTIRTSYKYSQVLMHQMTYLLTLMMITETKSIFTDVENFASYYVFTRLHKFH